MFTHWVTSHDITHTPFEALDQVMTDECTDQVMTNYYLPEDFDRKQVYKFLKDSDITGIYSRRSSDGCYSNYAVEQFGFPDDGKHNVN